jgi:hypothetical protein
LKNPPPNISPSLPKIATVLKSMCMCHFTIYLFAIHQLCTIICFITYIKVELEIVTLGKISPAQKSNIACFISLLTFKLLSDFIVRKLANIFRHTISWYIIRCSILGSKSSEVSMAFENGFKCYKWNLDIIFLPCKKSIYNILLFYAY